MVIGCGKMDIDIINLNHNGDGIGKIDGKVIFVSKTIIGDVVRVKDIVDYGNYYRGNIDSFIKYSDDRIIVKCPYYDRCGGCQIMGLSYNKQLEYKKDKVIDIFRKYCNIDISPMIFGSKNFGYRNKIIFQVKDGKIGFFEGSSNNFVEVDDCLLISDSMNDIISIIRDNIYLGNVDRIMLRDSLGGVMVVFYGSVEDIDVNIFKGCVCSVYVNDKKIYGRDNIRIKLGKYRFVVSSEAFFQVNLEVAEKLYECVKESIIKGSKVLDLYCGVGSIGIFCADKCKEVVGVEIDKSAIDNANINKYFNNIDNISFKCLNVNKLKYDNGEYDEVIVDPPRGGLDKKTIDIISNIRSEYIIYVSCNPITLVRDINRLNEYKVSEVKLFDMFPNSYHVECVCLLKLR